METNFECMYTSPVNYANENKEYFMSRDFRRELSERRRLDDEFLMLEDEHENASTLKLKEKRARRFAAKASDPDHKPETLRMQSGRHKHKVMKGNGSEAAMSFYGKYCTGCISSLFKQRRDISIMEEQVCEYNRECEPITEIEPFDKTEYEAQRWYEEYLADCARRQTVNDWSSLSDMWFDVADEWPGIEGIVVDEPEFEPLYVKEN